MADETIIPLDGRPFIDLCGSVYRQNILTGIMLTWLAQHFSRSDRIIETGIKHRVWDPDFEKSKIQILPVEEWKPQTTEQRPALLAKRGNLKFVRYGIDNRLIGGGGRDSVRRVHVGAMQGTHTIFCVAGEGGEAEQLSAEVSQELMKFAPIVRHWLAMLRVELVSIGPLSKLEEASENFVVPVDIAYAFDQEWELLSLDDPFLKEIRLNIGYPE